MRNLSEALKVKLVMLGKTRRAELRALLEDYLARLRHYAEVEAVELRDSTAALRKLVLSPAAVVVLLDVAGKHVTSEQFARWLGEQRRGTREIVFLCGDAEGFPEELRRKAASRLALSTLTFSHELARVMLAEQLYRAFTILSGHPYAK